MIFLFSIKERDTQLYGSRTRNILALCGFYVCAQGYMHTFCEYVWKPEGNPRGIPQLFLETASLAGLELLDKLGMVPQDPSISASPVLGLQTQATVPGSLKNFKIFYLQGKEFAHVVIIPAQWEGSSCLQCVKTLFTIHAHLFIHSLISMCTVHIHDCVVCSHTRRCR